MPSNTTSELPPVGLAIAGLGRWGRVLVDSVQGRSDAVRFVAALSRDPARAAAEATARQLSVTDDLDALLADPRVDGVVLATPHSRHAEQIAACLRAGKPVLVEKPFTLTRSSAAEVLEAARAAGILVAAAHNRRFLAPMEALKRLVDEGRLGGVLHVETHFSSNAVGRYSPGSWRVAEGESPAGGLAGSGIHQIDAIIHLAGPISEVFAWSARRVHDVPFDDTTAVLFRLASGGSAALTTITATAATYRVVVFGTAGKAELEGDAAVRGSETLVVTDVAGARETIACLPRDIERAELEAFAAAIRGRAPYPISHAEVLNGVAAFEAVSLSAAAGQPIKL